MIKRSELNIFVSHSHKDNQFGLKLVDDLRKSLDSNINIWYDAAGGLYGGDEWWSKILKELVKSSIFIVILSADSMSSKWVNDEITIAWAHKNSSVGKLIIPILHRNCKIREDLQTLHIISFLSPRAYEAAFDELIKRLQQYSPKPSTNINKLEIDKLTDSSSLYKRARQTRRLLRQNIIATKASGNSRYKPEAIRPVHQKSALRTARIEALRTARLEALQANNSQIEYTELPIHKDFPDNPIIL
jgi:TIR domain